MECIVRNSIVQRVLNALLIIIIIVPYCQCNNFRPSLLVVGGIQGYKFQFFKKLTLPCKKKIE